MLRITEQTAAEGSGAVLRLEGRVTGLWVAELRREVDARYRPDGPPVVLDLEAVSYIDTAGIEFFDQVATAIRVINCSLFAAEQLKDVLMRRRTVLRCRVTS
jgi:anti-anti-sigma regulatory factor